MKKSSAAILCTVGYSVFVFLFFSEPLSYNPIVACIVILFAFIIFFLFLTKPSSKLFEIPNILGAKLKNILPEGIVHAVNLLSELLFAAIPYALMFFLGWQGQKLWVLSADNKTEFYILFWHFAVLYIIIIVLSYFAKKSNHKRT